jgi:hypothetical protein
MDSLDGTRYVLLDSILGPGRPGPPARLLGAEPLEAEKAEPGRLENERASGARA